MDSKNREIATMAIQMNESHTRLSHIVNEIEHLFSDSKNIMNKLHGLKSDIGLAHNSQDVWEKLKFHFEKVHPSLSFPLILVSFLIYT